MYLLVLKKVPIFFKPIPCHLFLLQYYLKGLPPSQITLIKIANNIIFIIGKKIPQVPSSAM